MCTSGMQISSLLVRLCTLGRSEEGGRESGEWESARGRAAGMAGGGGGGGGGCRGSSLEEPSESDGAIMIGVMHLDLAGPGATRQQKLPPRLGGCVYLPLGVLACPQGACRSVGAAALC